MAFRPTVTVYYEGELIDCAYCRNFSRRGLIKAAMFLAAYLDDCRSADEIRGRLFGPEEAWPDEEQLKVFAEIEEWSDLPYLVDMSARSIYVGVGAAPPERLAEKKEVDLSRVSRLFSEEYRVLDTGTQIPFSMMDLEAVRRQEFYGKFLRSQQEWIKENIRRAGAAPAPAPDPVK